MGRENYVILVPGLGDNTRRLEWATGFWRRFGLTPVVMSMGWKDGSNFGPKLQNLVDKVDDLSVRGRVLIVGTSAGGSAAVNTYLERRDRVEKVVNVCGRLKVGTRQGIHSFEVRTASSPAFAQSVLKLESRLSELTHDDKSKILTVRARFGDQLVPAGTVIIDGAENISVPMMEHMTGIVLALTLYSRPLIQFLLKP